MKHFASRKATESVPLANISNPIGKAANAGKHPNGPVFSVRQSAGTRPNDYIRLYDVEFE